MYDLKIIARLCIVYEQRALHLHSGKYLWSFKFIADDGNDSISSCAL